MGLAPLVLGREGLTLTPWGDRPVSIKGLKLHGVAVEVEITGAGSHVGSLSLDGVSLPAGSRKIGWETLQGPTAKLELVRSETPPDHPVIVRADGLRVTALETAPGKLTAHIAGNMSGEVVVQASAATHIQVWGPRQWII